MITGTASIIRANSRDLPLADNSVDLVVTSPPYFALRSYQDGGEHYAGQIGDEPTPAEFVASLLDVTRECVRVLKPSGSLWVNLGDKYAGSRMDGSSDNGGNGSSIGANQVRDEGVRRGQGAVRETGGVRQKSLIGIPWRYALACIDDLGLILRAEVIWSKPNGLPESVTDRVRRSHETWFHFTLNPRYYSAVDTIRECTGESGSRAKYGRTRMGAGSGLPGAQPLATASSGSTAEPCSLTELPTSCGWDPSLMACSSIICAATASAATQHTSNPSPCKRTCAEALSLSPDKTPSRPTAETGTNTPTQTHSSYPQPEPECAGCAHASGTVSDIGPSESLGKLPGSVWTVPTEPLRVPDHLGIDHFAAFPTEWPKRIIQGWSPAGVCVECGDGRRPVSVVDRDGDCSERRASDRGFGVAQGDNRNAGVFSITGYACACPEPTADTRPAVVLDPFGGTGTTAMVAKALGRHGISVDMSADYCRLADWRTNDRNQLAKVLGVAKVDAPDAEQLDLFGEATA